MKKSVERIWNDVIGRKAVAISPSGCTVCGDNALWYSPFSEWKVCYLNRFGAYYLRGGKVERDEFD